VAKVNQVFGPHDMQDIV